MPRYSMRLNDDRWLVISVDSMIVPCVICTSDSPYRDHAHTYEQTGQFKVTYQMREITGIYYEIDRDQALILFGTISRFTAHDRARGYDLTFGRDNAARRGSNMCPQGKGSGTRDNSTLKEKLAIRERMLVDIRQHDTAEPIVLEAYGGKGDLYRRAYPDIRRGCVLERDPVKVDRLCWQRPTWAVYQGDSPSLIRSGIGSHLQCNTYDIDPYGQPWDAINSLFISFAEGLRPVPGVIWLVVNDGARQYLRRKADAIWHTDWLPADVVDRWGNALELNYNEVCKELLERAASPTGYQIADWEVYACGHVQQNTHFRARLER